MQVMKRAIIYIGYFIFLFVYCSCKRETPKLGSVAAITIVNAAIGSESVSVNFSDPVTPFYLNTATVSPGSSSEYSLPTGKTPVVIVSLSDTTEAIYQNSLDLKGGDIYSLYLIGQEQPKQIEGLLVRDTIPVYTDSLSAVRFVDLSPDAGQLSIVLQGNSPSQPEFGELNYRQISAFKPYPATNDIGGAYTFEIRNRGTGDLLQTFAWSYTLRKSNTLVIYGSIDPSSPAPLGVIQINNF